MTYVHIIIPHRGPAGGDIVTTVYILRKGIGRRATWSCAS